MILVRVMNTLRDSSLGIESNSAGVFLFLIGQAVELLRHGRSALVTGGSALPQDIRRLGFEQHTDRTRISPMS